MDRMEPNSIQSCRAFNTVNVTAGVWITLLSFPYQLEFYSHAFGWAAQLGTAFIWRSDLRIRCLVLHGALLRELWGKKLDYDALYIVQTGVHYPYGLDSSWDYSSFFWSQHMMQDTLIVMVSRLEQDAHAWVAQAALAESTAWPWLSFQMWHHKYLWDGLCCRLILMPSLNPVRYSLAPHWILGLCYHNVAGTQMNSAAEILHELAGAPCESGKSPMIVKIKISLGYKWFSTP